MSDGLYGKYKDIARTGGKGSGIGGFFLAFFANLAVHFYLGIPAIALLAAHFLVKWPLWAFWIALGVWLIYVLLLTILIAWGNAIGNEPTPERPNINPFSETSNDKYLQKK